MINSFLGQLDPVLMKPLFRYGIVGVVNNLLGYLAYLLLTKLGVDHKVAMTILYMLVLVVSFVINRKWTFSHEGNVIGPGIRYLFAYFIGYLINLSILIVMVDKFGYPHQLIQAVAIFLVAAFQFVTLKYLVFPKSIQVTSQGK